MAYDFQAAIKSGLSPDEIKSYLASKGRGGEADAYFSQQQPSTGQKILNAGKKIVNEVKDSYVSRIKNSAQSVKDSVTGKQSLLEAPLQVAGQAAGFVNDLVGTGTKTAVKAASAITPDSIEKPVVNTAKRGFRMVLQSPEGQAGLKAIQGGVETYNKWKGKNPRAAKNLEAVVNIASLLPVGKGAVLAKDGAAEVAGQTGKALMKTGEVLAETGGKVAKPVTSFGSKVVLGEDLQKAVTHFVDNADTVNAFRSGTRTYQSLADNVAKATTELDNQSFKAFQKVKQGLPEIKVPNSNLVGEVKKIVSEAPPLLPNEQRLVDGMANLIRGNKDQTIKGILDLRNRLDRSGFFRAGEDYINSNQVLRDIRSKLNEMAITRAKSYDAQYGTQYANKIAEALQKAHSDIDFLENVKTNLLGSNSSKYVEQTANKLKQIIGKIDDPTEYEATKNLLKELEARTGVNIVPDLESAKAATIINKALKLPGGISPAKTVGTLVNKAAVKGAEVYSKLRK